MPTAERVRRRSEPVPWLVRPPVRASCSLGCARDASLPDAYLSFAKTPSGGQEVDLSALIRRQSRVMRAASNGPFQRPLQPHRRKPRGRLSVCHSWGIGAPGGTRTPDPRLRSPSGLSVFSASCGTEGTLEGTNRLEGSAPPTTPLSSASGARTGKPARLDYRPRSSASEGSSSTYCRRHARGELPSRIPAPAPCGLRDAPCAASSPLFLISASPRNARAKPRAWRLPGPFPTPRTLASGAHGPADTTRGGLKHDLRRAPVRVRSLHAEVSRLREQLLRQGAPKRRARVERAAGPAPQFLLIGVSRGPPEQGRL